MRAGVAVCLCFALHASVAVAEGTAVLPVDAAGMGSDEAKLKRDVPVVLQNVLKSGYRAVPDASVPGGSLACSQSPACVQKVAVAVAADEVVFVQATRPTREQGADAYANLTLTLFTADGAQLLQFEQTITNSTGIVDLRGLAVQAFAPADYRGRVQLRGVDDGDEVLIDGLRLDDRKETALRAGPHKARIRRANSSAADAVEVAFVVPFEGAVVVEVPPIGGTSEPVSLPAAAPLWVHGATAAAATSALLGVVVRELIWRDSADLLERGTCPPPGVDESGAGFQNQGVSGLGACGAVQVELHQWVQLNRDLHLTLGIGMATVATAATTALLVTVLSPALSPPAAE